MSAPASLHHVLEQKLLARESELLAHLRPAQPELAPDPAEVHDFKELAAEEARLAVDEMALDQAAVELRQVKAALGRLQDGRHGTCDDCGQPIDSRRMLALPTSVCCAACQQVREAGASAAH